jgi:hypothetical protein
VVRVFGTERELQLLPSEPHDVAGAQQAALVHAASEIEEGRAAQHGVVEVEEGRRAGVGRQLDAGDRLGGTGRHIGPRPFRRGPGPFPAQAQTRHGRQE